MSHRFNRFNLLQSKRSFFLVSPYSFRENRFNIFQIGFIRRSEPLAGKQYVVVYPSYQYLASRQDDSSTGGFFETIQNYFINFGNSQSEEPMDAIEADKPQQAMAESAPTSAAPTLTPIDDVSIKSKFVKKDEKQKLLYSYITPASTVPLNSDRRFFYLSEQPQIFGSFSGPSVNPVFNLQPLPVVLQSRSSVASIADEPQSGNVISENVQKFSQIPPIVAGIEQSEAQMKSISDQFDTVVSNAAENRVTPLVLDNRALAIQNEAIVGVSSTVAPVSVEARNAIPIEVVKETGPQVIAHVIAQEKSDVLQPQMGAGLKDAVALLPVNPSVVVDQSVQSSEKVESITQQI